MMSNGPYLGAEIDQILDVRLVDDVDLNAIRLEPLGTEINVRADDAGVGKIPRPGAQRGALEHADFQHAQLLLPQFFEKALIKRQIAMVAGCLIGCRRAMPMASSDRAASACAVSVLIMGAESPAPIRWSAGPSSPAPWPAFATHMGPRLGGHAVQGFGQQQVAVRPAQAPAWACRLAVPEMPHVGVLHRSLAQWNGHRRVVNAGPGGHRERRAPKFPPCAAIAGR